MGGFLQRLPSLQDLGGEALCNIGGQDDFARSRSRSHDDLMIVCLVVFGIFNGVGACVKHHFFELVSLGRKLGGERSAFSSPVNARLV